MARFIRFAGVVAAAAWAVHGNGLGQEQTDPVDHVAVTSKASLVQLGTGIAFEPSGGGRRAAGLLLKALDKQDLASARAARETYRQLIPTERYGGDYTALEWFSDYLLASESRRKAMLADPFVANFYDFMAGNRFAVLKEYLRRKYDLGGIPGKDDDEGMRRESDLTDFILFANPRREEWEKTTEMLGCLGLRKGDTVADIGCGPGYHTFRFADLVGPAGKVYGVEINEKHIEYLNEVARKMGVSNVVSVLSPVDDVGLPAPVDLVFLCSLYHFVYGGTIQPVREKFVESIRRGLKDGGRLAVADNAIVEGKTLPYHGPRIAKELVAAQMKYYGFRLVAQHQFIPQRYVLIFEKTAVPPPAAPLAGPPPSADSGSLRIRSNASLVYQRGLGSRDSPEGCREAARLFLTAIEKKDRASAEAALAAYRKVIPASKRGSEYTAPAWFCEYWLASEADRKAMVTDRYTETYVRAFTERNYALLKEYLKRRFDLAPFPRESRWESDMRHCYLHEFIETLNPWRSAWEKADAVVKLVDLKPGDAVADIGSGPGFYAFRFAEAVGPSGKVYGIEINDQHHDYLARVARKFDVRQVAPILSRSSDVCMTGMVDVAFLCGVYNGIYSGMPDDVRDEFLGTIRTALKDDGRLVVVDTPLVENDVPFYFGPYTAKELVASQVRQHGFRLMADHQITPERYLLIFRKAEWPARTGAAAGGK